VRWLSSRRPCRRTMKAAPRWSNPRGAFQLPSIHIEADRNCELCSLRHLSLNAVDISSDISDRRPTISARGSGATLHTIVVASRFRPDPRRGRGPAPDIVFVPGSSRTSPFGEPGRGTVLNEPALRGEPARYDPPGADGAECGLIRARPTATEGLVGRGVSLAGRERSAAVQKAPPTECRVGNPCRRHDFAGSIEGIRPGYPDYEKE
jgi:hypothetical protein